MASKPCNYKDLVPFGLYMILKKMKKNVKKVYF